MDTQFGIDALEMAFTYGKPQIFNSDRAPVGAFVSSRDSTLFCVEKETAQRLTQCICQTKSDPVDKRVRN